MEITDDTAFWIGEKKYQCTKGVRVGNMEATFGGPPVAEFITRVYGYDEAIERGLIAEVEPTEMDLLKMRHRREIDELRAELARKDKRRKK